jgi:aryl-alcohol dehydrogenase-like predicted oxidoreductase
MKNLRSTEKIIGTWLKKSGRRDEVVLASKIAGPNPNFAYMRDTIDFLLKVYSMPYNSLSRLQTDYLDFINCIGQSETNTFGQRLLPYKMTNGRIYSWY